MQKIFDKKRVRKNADGKVDGRTAEGRALKAKAEAKTAKKVKLVRVPARTVGGRRTDPHTKRVPNAKRGGRPVGGRLPKLGDVVRITKGAEKHALGTIGNEDGKHWIVFEDRSNVGIRVRKTSVRLATLDERHIHNRKLVAIDVALTTFQNGDYERDDTPKQDDVEEVVWDDGAFPASVAAEWGLTKAENIEVAKLLVEAHGKHGGQPYSGEVTFRLSTGKQISLNHEADTPDDEAGFHFSYKPLAVVDVGGGKSDTDEDEDDDESDEDETEQLALPLNIVDGRDTAAAQSLLGD